MVFILKVLVVALPDRVGHFQFLDARFDVVVKRLDPPAVELYKVSCLLKLHLILLGCLLRDEHLLCRGLAVQALRASW